MMNLTQYCCLLPLILLGVSSQSAQGQDAAVTSGPDTSRAFAPSTLVPCADLPTGELSDEELARLVPEGSPGRVRIGWKTESQEDTYGFNIMRSETTSGSYVAINRRVIPGEGTSNIPKGYCYEDTSVVRGATYYYQIEEVTNSGKKAIIAGTAGTEVKVKTVEDERAWLKKKAAAAVEP